MAQLMDMAGRACGNYDEPEPPEGYWLRPSDAPMAVSRLEFLDRFGAARFAALWAAMAANPALAHPVMRGFAAETVSIEASFPALLQFEALGLIAPGSAIEVWS